jgi:hypothetical protein
MDELFPFLAGLITGLGIGVVGGFLLALWCSPAPDETPELIDPDDIHNYR